MNTTFWRGFWGGYLQAAGLVATSAFGGYIGVALYFWHATVQCGH